MDPGVGKGHHEKVQTAGKLSKFGIAASDLEYLLQLIAKHDVRGAGGGCCRVGAGYY